MLAPIYTHQTVRHYLLLSPSGCRCSSNSAILKDRSLYLIRVKEENLVSERILSSDEFKEDTALVVGRLGLQTLFVLRSMDTALYGALLKLPVLKDLLFWWTNTSVKCKGNKILENRNLKILVKQNKTKFVTLVSDC